MTRPSLPEALAQMRGKEFGVLLRPDEFARVQWPGVDGTLPAGMRRMRVVDARLESDDVVLELSDGTVSGEFRFAVDSVVCSQVFS